MIDIGSNTIRLMIYRVDGGEIHPVLNNKFAAGLAGYVTPKGNLGKDGIRRAVEVLRELRTVTEQLPLDGVFPFATASLRNISNTDKALEAIRRETGWTVRVLTGEEEARFDYYGALRDTELKTGLLVDVGGGSTELVYFAGRRERFALSLPIGSLNLYTRFVGGILPERQELRKIRQKAAKELTETHLTVKGGHVEKVVAVGGTARAVQKLYNSVEQPGGEGYPTEFYDHFLTRIQENPKALTDRVLKIAPERIHTITPGIAVLQTVAAAFGCRQVVTSPHGVREGYLYNILEERGILHGAER